MYECHSLIKRNFKSKIFSILHICSCSIHPLISQILRKGDRKDIASLHGVYANVFWCDICVLSNLPVLLLLVVAVGVANAKKTIFHPFDVCMWECDLFYTSHFTYCYFTIHVVHKAMMNTWTLLKFSMWLCRLNGVGVSCYVQLRYLITLKLSCPLCYQSSRMHASKHIWTIS